MKQTRIATWTLAALAAGAVLPGCPDPRPPPPPFCLIPQPMGGLAQLTCTATATFCVGGPPDTTGACPGGTEVRDPFEPFPGASMTCTGCVLSTGFMQPTDETCDDRLCRPCRMASGSGRCISCTASTVAVGAPGCSLSGIPMPGPGPGPGPRRDGGMEDSGIDAGPPPIEPEPHWIIQTYAYGGGTFFATDPIADFPIEDPGTPTAISADELLWVGFEHGALHGYDIVLGEAEIRVNLTTLYGRAARINNLQMYRADGRLFGVAALGFGIARFEIVGTSVVDRGMVETPFALDARIHPNEVLRDDGYVVGTSFMEHDLFVIPRIAASGAFPPRIFRLGAGVAPISVAPEGVPDGFVFVGSADRVDGRLQTFRSTDLFEVGSADFTGSPVVGIGGPDETATAAFELVAAINGATVGQIAALDPVTYASRGSVLLRGPIRTFATRAAGAELYAFATTATSGLATAELVAVIPTAGLTVRARHDLDATAEVHDMAIGLEPFFEPPEPDDPLPAGSTAAVHLLIELP